MTPPPGCPSPDALGRLGSESLDTEAFRALEAHLDACALCRERLEQFAQADTSGAMVRSPSPMSAQSPVIPGCILGRELGRGGWGVVYESEQPTLGRRVAVKILTVAPDLNEKARAHWLREARAAAKIRHPNIVPLHDAGEHNGRFYLVFDLVPGGSLRDLARGPIAPPTASRIVELIAGAAHAIHQDGLLHLDIKPANILMDGPPGAGLDAMTPMLSDFGIARETNDNGNATGTLAGRGTPSYMAPEQVAGRAGSIGPRSDVFAMGATLYALLTGRPPFQGTTAYETMELLCTTEPPPPRALAPKVPRDLETICLKALQKIPSQRYESAAAMADDLARWREGRPIRARRVSPLEQAARWYRRHPAPAALGTTLVWTILVALIGLTALWRRADQQRERAEDALARAIKSEESTDRVVDDLTVMLREAVEAPERLISEQSTDATESILDFTTELRRAPELAVKHAVPLATLELKLARIRYLRVDYDGAVRLLTDAADLLDLRYRANPDPETVAMLVEAILRCVESSVLRGDHENAVADLRQAARTLETLPDGPLARNELVDLHLTHRCLVYNLLRMGRDDEARRFSQEHANHLDAMVRRFPGSPVARLIARLDRAERAAEPAAPSATEWTREAFTLFPNGEGMPLLLERLLADLTARELLERAVAPATGDPNRIAADLLAEFDARCEGADVSPRFQVELIECLSQVGAYASIDARRAGRLDEARRHVGWMVALGKRLGERPDVLGGDHVMISRAYEHEAKIGWAEDDLGTVDRCLRAALVEAVLAADEAPEEPGVRVHLAGIREKYARFAAAEPEEPPAPPAQASR